MANTDKDTRTKAPGNDTAPDAKPDASSALAATSPGQGCARSSNAAAVSATDGCVIKARAADAGMFDLFLKVCPGEASGYKFGREPDGTPSRSWRWQVPDQSGLWSADQAAGH